MGLSLITGPAGSGKTGEVLERFADRLEEEPVLVVPTRADVERFEDELLARRPVALGGRIVTFERLFSLAADSANLVGPPAVTPAQRRALLAAVVRDAELRALDEPARRRGFGAALDRFVADAQAALVAPAELSARLRNGRAARRRHVEELGALYGAYVERRDALGRTDAAALAADTVAALRDRPDTWGERPVLVHGFDDLTPVQLALVEVLARTGHVLVSVLHEPGRACLVARRGLVERLERLATVGAATPDGGLVPEPEPGDHAGDDPAAPARRAPEAANGQLPLDLDAGGVTEAAMALEAEALAPRTGTTLLTHLERSFLTDAPERVEPDGGLRLLEAAGVRNEVEQAAAAIAELLRAGHEPDEIAVIDRSAGAHAALVEEVFHTFGIPAAVHADRAFGETGAGRGLLALLRAALTTRTAQDLVAFLRCPGRASAGAVDRLEQTVRQKRLESVEEVVAAWEKRDGRPLWELDALRKARHGAPGALLESTARIARVMAEHPHRRRAPLLDDPARADQLAAESAARWLEEVAAVATADPGLAPDGADLVALVEDVRVPVAGPSVAGCVEVMTPYRARARQFPFVFVLSLQEGEFPRRRRDDPFLADGERRAAGLPEPVQQRDEERYLFYVCLTRATRVLHLSFRSADEEGQDATRSFFVDEVLDLLSPGAEPSITRSKGLSATVFGAAAAPTERELARSLAERRVVRPPAALGASQALAERLEPMLTRARERADRLPGPLRAPFVLEEMAGKRLIGASSLELNAECSFRYFVDHELAPRELAPRNEPLVRGGITHRVLERLLSERRERPTPDTVEDAIARASEILGEEAAGTSLDPARASARPAFRRMESDIARFLRADAATGGGEVLAVEAGFGDRDDDERTALRLEGFELHGKIDRIDLVGRGQALIRDYKTGSTVATRKRLADEGKLQIPLYMLAVRELWGLEPVGGVYHPLGKQHDARPRGLLRGPPDASPLGDDFVASDYTADGDEFERALATARAEAGRLAARIHSGHLDRDPLGGSCPAHCDFHPICRRERGEKNPSEGGWREEEDGDG